jgi:hypothetical protein
MPGIMAGALALLSGSLLCVPLSAESLRSAWIPDYMRVQYAGQAGMVSAGPGYSWWHKRVETGLSYGYVPEFVSNGDVHILSQKNAVSLWRIRPTSRIFFDPVLIGESAQFSMGRKYEVLLPESQRDYYWPDGLFFWMFTGAKAGYMFTNPTPLKGVAAQIEVGTINQYLKAYSTNHVIHIDDILSLAISTQFYL